MNRLLVVGGSGALGKSVVNAFKKINWQVANIDVIQNDKADINYLIAKDKHMGEEIKTLNPKIKDLGYKFNSIICTAGGWAPGDIKDENVFDSVN